MNGRLSRKLASVLRHRPESIDIELEAGGWVRIDALLRAAGIKSSREEIAQVVAQNDKKRFTISVDGMKIRAAQGHSVPVDLGLSPCAPPALLFHGTATHSLASIWNEGLLPGGRHQVHLSRDYATAVTVGARHGAPIVLSVAAGEMHQAGHAFYQADNGVWLTDCVPVNALSFAASTE